MIDATEINEYEPLIQRERLWLTGMPELQSLVVANASNSTMRDGPGVAEVVLVWDSEAKILRRSDASSDRKDVPASQFDSNGAGEANGEDESVGLIGDKGRSAEDDVSEMEDAASAVDQPGDVD